MARPASPESAESARQSRMMLALMGVFCFYGIVCGDRMPLANGLGWDGQSYAAIAANPAHQLLVVGQTAYKVQRILPSLVVHLGLVLAGAAMTPKTIVASFLLLNSILLMGSVYLYGRLAEFLKLGIPARWLGFFLLFVNVNTIKVGFYYPVLTDISGLALGVAATYFFLTSRTAALAWTTVVGSLTWATSLPFGATLLLFPVSARPPYSQPGLQPARGPGPKLAAGAFALAVGGRLLYLYQHEHWRGVGWGPVVPAVEEVFYLSLFCTGLYAYLTSVWLFGLLSPANVVEALKGLSPARILLLVGVALPSVLAKAYLSVGKFFFTTAGFFEMTGFEATTRPAVFLVAHFVYFGPLFALLLLSWTSTTSTLARWGPGAVLFASLAALTLVSPESRQSLFSHPFLVVALVVGLERGGRISARLAWVVGALALALSRIWLPFVTGRADAEGMPDVSRFFAVQGPQMPNSAYLMHLIALVLATLVLAWLLTAPAPAPASEETSGGQSVG